MIITVILLRRIFRPDFFNKKTNS